MSARRAAATLLAALVLLPPAVASAQDASPTAGAPTARTGTLRTVAERGRITLGYRVASLPFSYVTRAGQPLGYSIDLCLAVAEAAAREVGRELRVEWRPVVPETRIPALLAGEIDLECGSTTGNAERSRQVAFSPVIFVAGTRLLVPRESRVRGLADLAGQTVVATAGTTTVDALRDLARRNGLALTVATEPDHAQSFARLRSGGAAALANDDVLLAGLLATDPEAAGYRLAGPLLSYEPYALMFRRDDPAFAALVRDTFARLARERALGQIYARWFLTRLPTGERLNVPLGPQLTEVFRMLGAPD